MHGRIDRDGWRESDAAACGRSGFSLVELLIVLIVMLSMMGMVLSVFAHYRQSSRIDAARQMVADALRSARSTAIATRTPCVITVTQVLPSASSPPAPPSAAAATIPIAGTIAGFSRHPVWAQTFDDPSNLTAAGIAMGLIPASGLPAGQSTGVVLGHTGYGVDPAQIGGADAASVAEALLTHPLTPAQLVQPAGSQRGLYLGCWVLPPPPGGLAAIPLVMLDTGGAQEASAPAGLRLQPVAATSASDSPQQAGWNLVGWVTATGTSASPGSSVLTSAASIPSGRWTQVGLLFDGTTGSLWIDGVQQASSLATGATKSWAAVSEISIGEIVDPALGNGVIMSQAIIDDIDYELVGTDQLGTFPDGIAPAQSTLVTVAPDGSMTATMMAQDGSIAHTSLPWALALGTASTGGTTVTTLQGRPVQVQQQTQPVIELCTYRDGVLDLSDLATAIIPLPAADAPTPDGGRGYLASWGLEGDGTTRIPVAVQP